MRAVWRARLSIMMCSSREHARRPVHREAGEWRHRRHARIGERMNGSEDGVFMRGRRLRARCDGQRRVYDGNRPGRAIRVEGRGGGGKTAASNVVLEVEALHLGNICGLRFYAMRAAGYNAP